MSLETLRPVSPRAKAQSLTIREADTYGKVKCNRCKKKLRGGGDCVRDRRRAGYVCKEGCGGDDG